MAGSIYIDFQKQQWFTALNQTRSLPYIYDQCKESILTEKAAYITNVNPTEQWAPSIFGVGPVPNTANYVMVEIQSGQEFIVTPDNVMKRTK